MVRNWKKIELRDLEMQFHGLNSSAHCDCYDACNACSQRCCLIIAPNTLAEARLVDHQSANRQSRVGSNRWSPVKGRGPCGRPWE